MRSRSRHAVDLWSVDPLTLVYARSILSRHAGRGVASVSQLIAGRKYGAASPAWCPPRLDTRRRVTPLDRIFWVGLSRLWEGWREVLVFVQPATVIAWQRRRFRDHWTRLSRRGQVGRTIIDIETRDLIRTMSTTNVTWGAPRIVGELAKIGVRVAKSTVERYMVRRRRPSSPTWRTFLKNHVKDIAATDFFVVPTVRFTMLYVFIVFAHHRRRVLHFNVTTHPTVEWTARQITEAFPYDEAPRYLLHDRDTIYGDVFRHRIDSMNIEEVRTAPHSPWQNPYCERLIGSIRRDCLDHMIILNERHLRRILVAYFAYYHESRTHLSLEMDCPKPRPVQPRNAGAAVAIEKLGGLHHTYERRAA